MASVWMKPDDQAQAYGCDVLQVARDGSIRKYFQKGIWEDTYRNCLLFFFILLKNNCMLFYLITIQYCYWLIKRYKQGRITCQYHRIHPPVFRLNKCNTVQLMFTHLWWRWNASFLILQLILKDKCCLFYGSFKFNL